MIEKLSSSLKNLSHTPPQLETASSLHSKLQVLGVTMSRQASWVFAALIICGTVVSNAQTITPAISVTCIPSILQCAAKIAAPGTVLFTISGTSISNVSEIITSNGAYLPPYFPVGTAGASIFPNITTVLPAGTYTVIAYYPGYTGYNRTEATTTLVVPNLQFSTISTQTFGVAPITVSASSASTGAISYSVTSGPATISGSKATIIGAGTVTLSAVQASTASYLGTSASTTFTVNKATPTLKFVPIPTQVFGVAPFTVSASSASTGVITYGVTSGPASLSGSTLTINGAGTITLSATQAATANYNGATASIVFLSDATPTITALSFSQGPVGMGLIITGTGFTETGMTTSVTVGGKNASIIGGVTSTQITVQVPAGATTGGVEVSLGPLSVPSASFPFTVTPAYTCE